MSPLDRLASAGADVEEEDPPLRDEFLGFKVPKTMTVGTTYVLRFAISPDESAANANAGRTDAAPPRVQVKVGRFMRARLDGGQAFDVRSTDANPGDPPSSVAPIREIGESGEAVWSWNVTPKIAGPEQILQITLSAMKKDAAGKYTLVDEKSSPPYPITVETAPVPFWQQIINFFDLSGLVIGSMTAWLKLLAGLVTAAGIVWIGIRKFGGSAAPSPPPA